MTKEQAKALYETGFWKRMTDRDIAEFQIMEERLCMPFQVFQAALESTLHRPVYTHELALNLDGIKDELFNHRGRPTLEDIINLIPEEKRIIILAQNER